MKINLFLLVALLPALLFAQQREGNGWWNADRSPLGIAPKPQDEPRAVVQIYTSRAYSWRGYFAVHPWVSVKEKNAKHFTTYEVMGFGGERGIPVIRTRNTEPDRRWFGSDPDLLLDIRGEAAEKMIPDIEKAVKSYPYPEMYRLWPGPNSNTFVSHIMRNTPGIYIELPPNAIGKDWIGKAQPIGMTESGTGFQVSIFGLLGFALGLSEGIEINILGMTFGIDFWMPAIKLPFIGRLGFKDRPVFNVSDEASEKKETALQEAPSLK